jgi:hypothetical protein
MSGCVDFASKRRCRPMAADDPKGAPYAPTAAEWLDIEAALRIAAASYEVTAIHLRSDDGELSAGTLSRAKIAQRRTSARLRKLAGRVRTNAEVA